MSNTRTNIRVNCDITDHIAAFIGANDPKDVTLHIGAYYYRRRVQFDPEYTELPLYMNDIEIGSVHISLYSGTIEKIRMLPHNLHGVMAPDTNLDNLFKWTMEMEGTMLPEEVYVVVRGICFDEPVRLISETSPTITTSSTMVVSV